MTDKVETIAKSEMLEAIRSERKRLEATLVQVGEEQVVKSRVEGEWSVKDVMAHLVAWERRMVRWLGEAQRGEVPGIPSSWNDSRY